MDDPARFAALRPRTADSGRVDIEKEEAARNKMTPHPVERGEP
jgi:hypothetical protein